MPNEIYHKSHWGNANAEGFGDVYFDAAATNKLYNHSDYYENSWGTDKILRDLSNKASITLTPTAYSNGSLNTVIPPYQVLQQELVTNGTFDTDSDWTKGTGWSISDGTANCDGSQTGNSELYQLNVFTVGKLYRLTFDLLDYSAGNIRIRCGTNTDVFRFANGTYTVELIAQGDAVLRLQADANFIGSIDNISIKEIQEADFDFSRGSSATRVNEKGLIESIASGLPRIDYTSGFGSLLLEPQRRNDIPYSEDFTSWAAAFATKEYNVAISPDGTQNASRFNYDGTLNGRVEYDAVTGLTSGISYTISVYLKSESGNIENVQIGNDGWGLKSVTVTNEWQRFTQTVTSNSTSAYPRVRLDAVGSILAWGYQLEAGSYATSYIVSNSGSATTRSADVANNSGNADLFNDSEGVLYAEISALADDSSYRFLGISDGTTTNRVNIMFNNNDTLDAFIGGVGTFDSDANILDFNKAAIKYKSGDYAFWVNGFEVEVSTSTSGLHSGLNTLNFDIGNGSNDFYGKTKELAVFKEALTDAELESLTSWVSFTEMATDLEYTLE